MFNRGIALAATAALALMASPSHAEPAEYRRMEPLQRPRRPRRLKKLRRLHARGSTKKCGAFRYKGSKRAKRASRRGGNPAAH